MKTELHARYGAFLKSIISRASEAMDDLRKDDLESLDIAISDIDNDTKRLFEIAEGDPAMKATREEEARKWPR